MKKSAKKLAADPMDELDAFIAERTQKNARFPELLAAAMERRKQASAAEEKPKKIRKMEPYTARWERIADKMARERCPAVYPCGSCGHPVFEGWSCNGCGTTNPRANVEDDTRS